MKELNEFLKQLGEAPETMELSAIWILDNPIVYPDGTKLCRVTEGDLLRVVDGILERSGLPTHRVVGCYCYFSVSDASTHSAQKDLQMLVADLKSNQPIIINVN